MTNIRVRIKLPWGDWVESDIDELTDADLEEFTSDMTPQQLATWVRRLVAWIRDEAKK